MNAVRRKTKNMNTAIQEPILLDVLRVPSNDVLGQTKPLSIASPFGFSNAKGDLKSVDSYAEIRRIASASAASFTASMTGK